MDVTQCVSRVMQLCGIALQRQQVVSKLRGQHVGLLFTEHHGKEHVRKL